MTKAVDVINELKSDLKRHKLDLDVALLSDDDSPCTVDAWISTGCLALDVIMGGGIPVGRLTEFFGDPSSGKSLIAAQIAANAQDDGYIVGYCDTETAVSKSMMAKLGVDVNNLIYASPDTVGDVFTFFDKTIDAVTKVAPDNYLLLIWDSVAATSTKEEMEKDYGSVGYTNQARVISQALRKITRKISKQQVALVFLNQTREKIGVMYGDKVATFGGKAVSFHSSVRVQLDLSTKLKVVDGKRKKIVGMNTRAVCVKNKTAMPFREAILPIYFGHGVDDEKASYLWLVDNGYITGTQTKSIMLDIFEIKFKASDWAEIYDKYYEGIGNLMLDSIDEGDK